MLSLKTAFERRLNYVWSLPWLKFCSHLNTFSVLLKGQIISLPFSFLTSQFSNLFFFFYRTCEIDSISEKQIIPCGSLSSQDTLVWTNYGSESLSVWMPETIQWGVGGKKKLLHQMFIKEMAFSLLSLLKAAIGFQLGETKSKQFMDCCAGKPRGRLDHLWTTDTALQLSFIENATPSQGILKIVYTFQFLCLSYDFLIRENCWRPRVSDGRERRVHQ